MKQATFWAIERSQNPVLYFDFRETDGLPLKMALVDGGLFLCIEKN